MARLWGVLDSRQRGPIKPGLLCDMERVPRLFAQKDRAERALEMLRTDLKISPREGDDPDKDLTLVPVDVTIAEKSYAQKR